MKLSDLKSLAEKYFKPETVNYLTYLEQSLYCVFLTPENKQLTISLNVLDKVIYIYNRDKTKIENASEIFVDFKLSCKNNMFYHSVKNVTWEKACLDFTLLIRNAEFYFKDIPVKNSKTKKPIIGPYRDQSSNKIISPTGLVNCHFQFLGKNNEVIISPKANLQNVFLECVGDNNKIIIGENVSMHGYWRLGFDCTLKIGNKTSSTNPVYITCAEHTCITIGEDCMFSTNNQIRTDDSHAIYDVNTGKRVNPSKNIVIGNHVWVAYGATILGGAEIGQGSVIGAYSLVKKAIPNNCIAAGLPAKVIRKNIFWERPLLLNEADEKIFPSEYLQQKAYIAMTEE